MTSDGEPLALHDDMTGVDSNETVPDVAVAMRESGTFKLYGDDQRGCGCTNKGRVGRLLDEVERLVAARNLGEARNSLDKLIEMVDEFRSKGYCGCVESIAPACFETDKGE